MSRLAEETHTAETGPKAEANLVSRQNDVMVVDARRQFVEYIPAAWARRWLKQGRATILRKVPCVIQLPPGVTSIREAATRKKSMARFSWLKFFEEPRDIWIQNLSATVLSFEIEGLHGGENQPVKVCVTPHPKLLSAEAGFDAIKNSRQFRTMANKRKNNRPVMAILDEAEVDAYFTKFAQSRGLIGPDGEPDIDAAMGLAEDEHRRLETANSTAVTEGQQNLHSFAPPKTAQELIAMDLETRGFVQNQNGDYQMAQRHASGRPIMLDEVVNPRILHLCQQVNPMLPGQKMDADTFFRELSAMQNVLTTDDLMHIEAHGAYPGVKKWARDQLAARHSAADDAAPQVAQSVGIPHTQQPSFAGQVPQGFVNGPNPVKVGGVEDRTVLGPDGQPLI